MWRERERVYVCVFEGTGAKGKTEDSRGETDILMTSGVWKAWLIAPAQCGADMNLSLSLSLARARALSFSLILNSVIEY